jgi:ABC-type cobalamin transport system permease subunit
MLSSKRLGLLLVAIGVIAMALTAFVIYLSTTPR